MRRNRQKHTGEKSTWKFHAEKQKRKFSDELAQIVLWFVSAFARNMPNPTCRSFRMGKQSFPFTLFFHGIFMRSENENIVPRSLWNVLFFPNAENSIQYHLVSCVGLWKSNEFYLLTENIVFPENHSKYFRAVCIISINVSKVKTLSPKERTKKKLFRLSTNFEITFCVFVFPSFPFSRLRTFHWLGTTQRYLLLKSSSFILLLFPQNLLVVKATASILWIS